MEAKELLFEHLKDGNLRKHCIATGAAMRGIAEHLGESGETWERAGLLHDIDLDETGGDMAVHGLRGAEILREAGESEELVDAVLAHADKKEPEAPIEKALWCVDNLTGLIVSATLVVPSKKIRDLKVKSVMKRFKEKRFAAGADREHIAACETLLDIPLREFVTITLDAMQSVDREIGL